MHPLGFVDGRMTGCFMSRGTLMSSDSHFKFSSLSLCWATHGTPEEPVILTPAVLQTSLIHTDILLLVGVLIAWNPLALLEHGPI